MELLNLMEEEVMYTIKKLLKDREDLCGCEKCQLDIAAIALNNLKPKYAVTEKGSIYGRVDTLNYQFDADLIREIIRAITIVGDKPRHD